MNQVKINFIMIFITKSSSKPCWSFKNNIKLIKNIYILKKILIFKFNLKLIRFILINSCIIFQINFLESHFNKINKI
jgi:hypothetical protein